MAKKLDLTVYSKQYFEVTLPDGDAININKPSQELIIDLMVMEQKAKEASGENVTELMALFNDIILKIISGNKEGKKFTVKYVKDNFDFQLGQIFLNAYMEFVQEAQSNPNS